jgi:Holliday junction resolvase RusA-like endonuclease
VITARWPRQRHLVDTAVALGDVDAPVSSIQDALQRAGVLDDDIRLVELHATKTHDAARPGVVIALVRVAEEDSP